jgi:N-acetylglucosaminyl-diphospho-decaprenol L-rhamnosyltransferase
MSLVDVVVVSYNSRARLRSCVGHLVNEQDLGVIVVDNASPDRSLDAVSDLPLTAVALPGNDGFAHGCNAGIAAGSAPYVLLLNPDAHIRPETVRQLVDAMARDERIGAAAPRIVGEDGSLELSLRRFPRLRSTYAQAFFLHRVFPRAEWVDELERDTAAYERAGSPEWVSGACVLLRRSAVETIGGLDDGFFMYCEDIDLCRRLRDAGYDIRFVPQAVVTHEGGASAPRASLLHVLAASRVRYAHKHRGWAGAALERFGVGLGALTHALVARGGRAVRAGHMRALRQAMSCHSPQDPPLADGLAPR